jgi:hypothetical protein
LIADGDCRELLNADNAKPERSSRPKNGDPIRPLGVTQVRETAACQVGSHGRKQAGRGSLNRKIKVGLALGVFDKGRTHHRISDIDRTERSGSHDAAEPAQASGGVPGKRFRVSSVRRGLGGDKYLSRGQLIEPANDAVTMRAAAKKPTRRLRRMVILILAEPCLVVMFFSLFSLLDTRVCNLCI